MTNDKILLVLSRYERTLDTDAGWFRLNAAEAEAEHLKQMIPQMRGFLQLSEMDPSLREKTFRWLGFMQGVFWALGTYSLDELKEHNREG